ncbi:Tripartite-type tricarboxylate transporter, receptor component TctC [Variovorax sp. CF079]|uniref:Bug family tripartite tricarboxylate transporter substrate binding protein n=1 Tax=Variovorax sp. CF079 TaxID=1882774 RepID=UPI00088377EB|nr:tripartite tricarboxylate transporter substrate binding protein [Variovorax sp. CF079]SDC92111.1 Tripartite-type tricarboxylate transporter, receptor component TctC [Variovorax sp. CF079]
MLLNRRSILVATMGVACSAIARAELWPRKPVRIILNFPAGGPGDAIARYLAQRMSAILGQQVFVENRSGGAGAVGILAASNAQADGYTFLYTTVTGVVQVPLVSKDQNFDPLRSVVPVMGIGSTPMGLFVHASTPVADFPGFIEWARKQPAGLDIGGGGPIVEIATAVLARSANVRLVYVPFRGTAPVVQAALAGDIKAFFSTPSPVITENIRAGKLRAIAVTSASSSSLVPGVDPIAKFIPGYVQDINFGFFAPAGIPAEAVVKFSETLAKVLAEPEMKERLSGFGLGLQPLAASEMARITARDAETIRKTLETTPVKFGE